MCFGKERASISRLAEMRHFGHELINVALHTEAVMAPFCLFIEKKYWEKEKVTLEK